VSIVLNNKSICLLDVFNSAQYELVPYTVYKDMNIGYPNVLNMFMLIDMWFLRFLSTINIINVATLNQYISTTFNNLADIDKIKLSRYSKEQYLGTYVNLLRYKHKKSLNNDYFPYNPEQHRYQKGQYRII